MEILAVAIFILSAVVLTTAIFIVNMLQTIGKIHFLFGEIYEKKLQTLAETLETGLDSIQHNLRT